MLFEQRVPARKFKTTSVDGMSIYLRVDKGQHLLNVSLQNSPTAPSIKRLSTRRKQPLRPLLSTRTKTVRDRVTPEGCAIYIFIRSRLANGLFVDWSASLSNE